MPTICYVCGKPAGDNPHRHPQFEEFRPVCARCSDRHWPSLLPREPQQHVNYRHHASERKIDYMGNELMDKMGLWEQKAKPRLLAPFPPGLHEKVSAALTAAHLQGVALGLGMACDLYSVLPELHDLSEQVAADASNVKQPLRES